MSDLGTPGDWKVVNFDQRLDMFCVVDAYKEVVGDLVHTETSMSLWEKPIGLCARRRRTNPSTMFSKSGGGIFPLVIPRKTYST